MSEIVQLILQLGLAFCFLYTGISHLRDPDSWEKLLRPWVAKLLGRHRRVSIILNGLFDLTVGLWLLTPWFTWLVALIAALHFLQIYVAIGINRQTYRDVGLSSIAVALLVATWPA